MTTINTNAPTELPSSRTLLRSTLIALAVAMALLVTVVLPAEYAIDPTGIGRALTQMGEIKMSLAEEAAAAEAAEAALLEDGAAAHAVGDSAQGTTAVTESAAPSSRSDVTTITLRPNEGKEVKLEMHEGASVTYAWSGNPSARAPARLPGSGRTRIRGLPTAGMPGPAHP
jgi:hypothetical protein